VEFLEQKASWFKALIKNHRMVLGNQVSYPKQRTTNMESIILIILSAWQAGWLWDYKARLPA